MNLEGLFISQNATKDGALRAKLTRSQKFVLHAFILLQAVHSMIFVTGAVDQLITHLHFGDWRVPLERMVAAIIVLVLMVAALRAIARFKLWAWGFVLILVIDVVCYGFWAWAHVFQLPKVILIVQLALVPLVLAALWKTRLHCGVTFADLCATAAAIVIAAVVVIVRGRYYPVSSPDWSGHPLYYRLLAHSGFHGPQEQSLALLLALQLALSWIFKTAFGTSNKASGPRP